jgi:hypothetical protein
MDWGGPEEPTATLGATARFCAALLVISAVIWLVASALN